jgi:hypothetical protein
MKPWLLFVPGSDMLYTVHLSKYTQHNSNEQPENCCESMPCLHQDLYNCLQNAYFLSSYEINSMFFMGLRSCLHYKMEILSTPRTFTSENTTPSTPRINGTQVSKDSSWCFQPTNSFQNNQRKQFTLQHQRNSIFHQR